MKNSFIFFIFLFVFGSCKKVNQKELNSSEISKEKKIDEGFEMYEMSEMAALMEQMYVDNERLKVRIIKGDTIGQFPQHFKRIHEAVLTDETDKDAFFKEQSTKFIQAQELIYKDPKNAKEHFNNGIDEASSKTNGLTKVLQAFNVAIGFVSDGFKGIQIAANLFVGIIYDLAAAWVQLVSKFTWGDVKQQAIADMDAMATKAQEYYKKASDGALEFKSKGVKALDEIGKTQDQKNAENLAQSKASLDQMLANQQTELNGKKVTEDEKLKAVTAYAEAAIAANKGVMDGMMQADLIAKGYMVTMDQTGKVSVQAFNQAADSANNTGKALVQARKGAEALGVDLDIALNRVSEKFAASFSLNLWPFIISKTRDCVSNFSNGIIFINKRAVTSSALCGQFHPLNSLLSRFNQIQTILTCNCD